MLRNILRTSSKQRAVSAFPFRYTPRSLAVRFCSTSTPNTTPNDQLIDIAIPNPALLLNDIAQRYSSASRIVMEYVDNAIDDLEDVYRLQGVYPGKGLHIRIVLDPKNRCLLVRDQSLGMDKEKLIRVLRSIGSSQKKSISWLNGNFGFGIHAFRAACRKLYIRSAHQNEENSVVSQHLLQIDRQVSSGLTPPKPCDFTWDQAVRPTGTEILMEGIDPIWAKDLNPESIRKEVELHFESLLRRKGLRITVEQGDLRAWLDMFEHEKDPSLESLTLSDPSQVRCRPFDYGQVQGKGFSKQLSINGCNVQIELKVADREYSGHRARFFNLGRRINDVASVDSFMKVSAYKYALWNHPQLLGYIELAGCVEPVITRDEFRASEARKLLYEELLKLEKGIKASLDEELEKYRAVSFMGMEGTLGRILESLFNREAKGYRFIHKVVEPAPAKAHVKRKTLRVSDGEEKVKPPVEQKSPMFDIRFSKMPPNDLGEIRRSVMVDNMIEINVEHPDFHRRLRSKQGKPVFDDRLIGYLASVVSANFRMHAKARSSSLSASGGGVVSDTQSDNNLMAPEEFIGTFAELEAALKRKLPALKRKIEGSEEDSHV